MKSTFVEKYPYIVIAVVALIIGGFAIGIEVSHLHAMGYTTFLGFAINPLGGAINKNSLAALANARSNAVALNSKCVNHPKQLNQK